MSRQDDPKKPTILKTDRICEDSGSRFRVCWKESRKAPNSFLKMLRKDSQSIFEVLAISSIQGAVSVQHFLERQRRRPGDWQHL